MGPIAAIDLQQATHSSTDVNNPPQRQPKKKAAAKKATKRRKAAKKAPKRKIGRPSKYSKAMAERICRRLYEDPASGEGLPHSLRTICKDPKMPDLSTVCRWLSDERKPEFRLQYAQARELRKWALVDRLEKLSREAIDKAVGAPGTGEAGARVQAVKLEIDAIKWILSKEYARDYGALQKHEVSGPDGGPVQTQGDYKVTPEDEEVIKRIAQKRQEVAGK